MSLDPREHVKAILAAMSPLILAALSYFGIDDPALQKDALGAITAVGVVVAGCVWAAPNKSPKKKDKPNA